MLKNKEQVLQISCKTTEYERNFLNETFNFFREILITMEEEKIEEIQTKDYDLTYGELSTALTVLCNVCDEEEIILYKKIKDEK